MFRRKLAIGLTAGLVAAIAMILVSLFFRYAFGIPTPSEMFGDRLVPTYNANEFLGLLGKLGGYNRAKQIGVLSVLFGQLAVGAIVGAGYSLMGSPGSTRSISGVPEGRRLRTAVIFVAIVIAGFWVGSVIFFRPVLDVNFIGIKPSTAGLVTRIGLAVSYLFYGASLVLAHRWIVGSMRAPVSERVTRRRAFVVAGVGAAMAAGLVFALRHFYRIATFAYDGKQYIGPDVQPVTPNDGFYTVTKNIVDPDVDRARWRLEIAGLVENPRTYTFEELAGLEASTQETTLMCISNWVGGGLMSNAIWQGVPLRDLITTAIPKDAVVEVLFRAVDGYTDTVSFEKAMDPTTLLAFAMNGQPLPRDHGYPVRVIVPGMYGEKNVKWVTRIELVDHDAKGFYEQQGWGPDFRVPIRSRFDFPYYDQTMKIVSPITLKGIAFGGDRGVSKVEVSVDGEGEWREARIHYPGTHITWALWQYEWSPPAPGEYKLVVRATDGKGELQSAVDRSTVPEGATGYHRVTLRLET